MLRKGKKIYLACGSTDMRKNSSSLSAIVSESIKLDPFDDALFVFCNNQRNILKILEWDGDGFWLHTKKLEKGRFQWPNRVGGTLLASKFKRREILNPGA